MVRNPFSCFIIILRVSPRHNGWRTSDARKGEWRLSTTRQKGKMEKNKTVTTSIDRDKCISCGECIKVCPKNTLSLVDKKAAVVGSESLVCDHCRAVCTSGAITVKGIDRSLSRFSQFKVTDKWLPYGKFDTPSLVNLMQSRRSCRNYKDAPVSREVLEDLVKIGITAPSGSNCQQWSFTLLPDRASVLAFGNRIKRFFAHLNRLAEKTLLRRLLKWIGKPELDWYYTNYYQEIEEALERWDKSGKDLLFHGAPAAIVVGSANSASCPAEDALLATQNILLGAHSLGLGTCLVGFAIRAMDRDKTIRTFINMPEEEDPYAVIVLGYPNETYRFTTGRKPVKIRTFQASGE
jgi:nitroreductase/Pyruvate/2-oxoacid:ferredoxin oxidoreductase delta subunit